MSGSVRATIVALRHVEDELSLARTKSSKQALDTVALVVPNVSRARDRLRFAVAGNEDPVRKRQLNQAIDHIDDALSAAHHALHACPEDQLNARLREIIEHLIIATTYAEDE